AQEASKVFAGAMVGTYMRMKLGDYTICGDNVCKDIKNGSGQFYVLGKDGKKLNFMQFLDFMYTQFKQQQEKYMAQYQEMMSQYSNDDDDMAYADEELVETEME
ncbi:MAG: hypothetical protein II034_10125, partial [Muribaculaceae bacterium]|nr:hypothetical protein [Muribaculaceae bacterium]